MSLGPILQAQLMKYSVLNNIMITIYIEEIFYHTSTVIPEMLYKHSGINSIKLFVNKKLA